MSHRLLRLLLMLTVLALLGESTARAEMVDFSYSWSIQPSSVIPGGTGSVTFAIAPTGNSTAELGSLSPAIIPAATVTTTSSATDTPDSFNTDFHLTVGLTDIASGFSGNLTFDGTLSGNLTATNSSLTSTFFSGVTQSLTLGNHVYSVTIDPTLINLPVPGSPAPVLIDALVHVNNRDPGIPTAPEPSSLVLGATAVAGLFARRWLRRRPA